MTSINGKRVKIIKCSNSAFWYADKVNEQFIVQSECSRDKNSLIVRTTIAQAGWKYGWIEKSDCVFI